MLASAGSDRQIKLWQTNGKLLWQGDGSWLKMLPGHQQAVNRVSFSPDGQVLAAATDKSQC